MERLSDMLRTTKNGGAHKCGRLEQRSLYSLATLVSLASIKWSRRPPWVRQSAVEAHVFRVFMTRSDDYRK